MSTTDEAVATPRPGGRPNQREHIVDAALRLMSERGSSGMSMRQLARACDLNVAAIYHYFESKEALLAAVVDERQYGARLAEIPPLDPADPPAVRLRTVFITMWQGALAEEAVWRVLLGEGLRGESGVIPVGKSLLDVLQPGLGSWLRTGVPELADPDAAAAILIGQMLSGFIRHVFDPAASADEIGDEAADAVIGAFGPSL